MSPKQLEIDHIAEQLLDRYAGEAELIAWGQADTMLDIGDLQRFESWKKVMAVLSRRQRITPHLSIVSRTFSRN